jgi:hypothetical protein
MSATAIQPATASAASRKFKAWATTFSISGPVIYCLVVYFNYPVFTYWPADGRFAWGFGAASANDGPNMLWYGWTITTVLIALALGLVATLVPERITRKLPLWLAWLLPILAIPYVIYSLMFWWTLAAHG